MIQKKEAMETKFNFKSAICTSREQSERLLALGLKKETADCNYPLSMIDGKPCQNCPRIGNPLEQNYNAFPAWSLHRLICMLPEEINGGLLCVFKDSIRYEEVIMDRLEAHFEVVGDNMYENALSCIEWLIKEGYFNKEYLCKR